jgi:hypothetical protein
VHRSAEDGQCPGAKLSLRGGFSPLGVIFYVRPSILLNSRECSPLGVNEGVNITPRGLGENSPKGWLFTMDSFSKITKVIQIFGLLFCLQKKCINFNKKWVWSTYWAIFLQTRLRHPGRCLHLFWIAAGPMNDRAYKIAPYQISISPPFEDSRKTMLRLYC